MKKFLLLVVVISACCDHNNGHPSPAIRADGTRAWVPVVPSLGWYALDAPPGAAPGTKCWLWRQQGPTDIVVCDWGRP